MQCGNYRSCNRSKLLIYYMRLGFVISGFHCCFLLRCLKWHTPSSARAGPCGGRWPGVSIMMWLFRWVCADFSPFGCLCCRIHYTQQIFIIMAERKIQQVLCKNRLHILQPGDWSLAPFGHLMCSLSGYFQNQSHLLNYALPLSCSIPSPLLRLCPPVPLETLIPPSREIFILLFLTCCSQATLPEYTTLSHCVISGR